MGHFENTTRQFHFPLDSVWLSRRQIVVEDRPGPCSFKLERRSHDHTGPTRVSQLDDKGGSEREPGKEVAPITHVSHLLGFNKRHQKYLDIFA